MPKNLNTIPILKIIGYIKRITYLIIRGLVTLAFFSVIFFFISLFLIEGYWILFIISLMVGLFLLVHASISFVDEINVNIIPNLLKKIPNKIKVVFIAISHSLATLRDLIIVSIGIIFLIGIIITIITLFIYGHWIIALILLFMICACLESYNE